jgi:aminopeptidase-like protein
MLSRLTEFLTAGREAFVADGQRAHDFARDLFPICRSVTGEGLRATLARIAERIPLATFEVPSGTAAYDWSVPNEWNIRDAYVRNSRGEKVIDFAKSNLHVVNYSSPINRTMSLQELRPHLHALREHPDWIPYRTSYYKETWGFCLAQHQLDSLEDGLYEVVIDSRLEPGNLTYAECVIPGESVREMLLFTHCCHPSTCNDNLSGVAVMTLLAEYLLRHDHRLTYRVVFAPATIGSITWLSRNEPILGRIDYGLVLGLLGDAAPLQFKRSRRGTTRIDQIAQYVLRNGYPDARLVDFTPYGYDERQFCSPGIDLPLGRLTRSSNGEYPEYHSSADNLDFISATALGESLRAALQIVATADSDLRYRNTRPKCEPRLGKYGLYRPTGGTGPNAFEYALLWVLNQSDGSQSLLDIAQRSGITYGELVAAAAALEQAGLLEVSPAGGSGGQPPD